jgi:UDP-N-acetylmuramoylalanine--D-glutamate ligase
MMPHNCHPVISEAHENDVPVISTFDAFVLTHDDAKIVGITGTNGKSTTAALTNHVLKKNCVNSWLGGNYGIPYFDAPSNVDAYIFEMSSYELASSKYLKFEVGCILNIEVDHLEFHGNFDEYVKAKYRLLDNSKVQIISADDENVIAKYPNAIRLSTQYKPDSYAYIHERALFNKDRYVEMDLSGPLNLLGPHNHQNIVFAYAICRHFGIEGVEFSKNVMAFQPLPHRLNIVRKINNITFVNDSKATNPVSAANALKTFVGYTIYWLVGGRSKKTDPLEAVGAYMDCVKKVYLFGEAADEFEEVFRDVKKIVKCETMFLALNEAYHDALLETEMVIVLLSPMCSSFDQFKSFEHRGTEFARAVSELPEINERTLFV